MNRQMTAIFAALLVGAAGGYWLKSTDMPAPEVVTAKPAVRQTDGSLVAERAPALKPSPPPHQIPKGAREERRVSATVKPRQPDCDPVRLDMSLVRDDEGGRRVVLSSPDGEVTQALDMPLQSALTPAPQRPWAIGALYAPARGDVGVWVERDLGRLRLGADLVQQETGDLAVMARIGWRF